MNFELSAEQEMLRETLQRFADDKCTRQGLRAVVAGDQPFDRGLWDEIVTLELLGTGIAPANGGSGGSIVEAGLVAEALGRGLAPVPFVPTLLAALLIQKFGSDHQRVEWLPGLVGGQTLAAVAELIEGRIEAGQVTGTSRLALDGELAGIAVIALGEQIGVVALDAQGVSRRPVESMDPARRVAELRFQDAPIALLSPDGTGWRRDAGAVMLAFEQLGGAEKVIEDTRAYVIERRTFGRSLGSYQVVKHRLVDMHLKTLMARAHAYHGAWALDTDTPRRPLAAASARVAASEAYRFSARESVQLHGALGTSWEHDAHLHLRRAETLALAWGGSTQWKERIVADLESAHG